MNAPHPIHPSAEPAPSPQGANDPIPDRAESGVQGAPAVPDMNALHIQLLHRMALASGDLAETLQAQVKHRVTQELDCKPVAATGADPALVFTHVVRCLRHCVALAQHLEEGAALDGTRPPTGKAGKRAEPAPPVPQDPKEAAKATIRALLEERTMADKDCKDPQEELDAWCGQFDDPEVYDALGEEPDEHVICLILHKLYFSDGRFGWRETLPARGAVPETPEEAADKAAEQARYEAERDIIVAATSEAILNDPRPADVRGLTNRLEKWVKRSAMRARIGREPNDGIIKELLTGLGLPPLAAAEPPALANGHDPP